MKRVTDPGGMLTTISWPFQGMVPIYGWPPSAVPSGAIPSGADGFSGLIIFHRPKGWVTIISMRFSPTAMEESGSGTDGKGAAMKKAGFTGFGPVQECPGR
ncbi:MAG: hypothetical protein IPF68_13975 [Bacteroidales bacterium]|nr:hypothetical protein [Bacteroidales bacterium]